MKLPVFELLISEDLEDNAEVNFVALVDRPAIQRNWSAFKEKAKFEIVDEELRIISGAIMLSDTPIYRNDSNHGEYYVVFSKDTIYKIVQKYFKKGYQANVNLGHDPNLKQDGIVMFESWIVDKKRGVLPMKGFEDVPDGSWFGSMKIENDEVWEKVKSGEFKGFSVEGIFEYKMQDADIESEQLMQSIYKILNEVDFCGDCNGFGGEGSGCSGDNCGRPKGSGSDSGGSGKGGGGRIVQPNDKDLIELMDKAKVSAPELDKMGKDLAAKHGADITPINLKSEKSILRKVNEEENGDLTKVKDSVRNTIVHPDNKAIENVIADMEKDPRFLRVKKQRHEDDPLGYNGNIVNVRLGNGAIGEIQVNTPKMIYAKEKKEDAIRTIGQKKYDEIAKSIGVEGGKGHTIYEEYRNLDPKNRRHGKRMRELEKESRSYYKNFLD